MAQPEYKHVVYFVTGMVVVYWKEVMNQPPVGEQFDAFLEDSITKVWGYLTEDRSTGDFHDYQTTIALTARQVFPATPQSA